MKCPVCGSSDNNVVDSVKTYTRRIGKKGYLLNRLVRALRLKDVGELARQGGVARRRHCQHCNCLFITHETMAQIMRTKR
jgi:transcriptional regulator NrdR family protein